MPQIFKPIDPTSVDKDIQKDYFDRHTPVIICNESVSEGEKMQVKVKLGTEYAHPDEGEHHIGLIQLWNRETLVAEAKYFPGALGNKPGQLEVDFYIVPKVSMNLTVLSYCTKHGLWQSNPKEVKVIHQSTGCTH
jgi:superoxide reductase